MIALFAAVLAITPTAAENAKRQADAYTADEIAYGRSISDHSDWRFVSISGGLLIFTKPYAVPTGANPKIWIRVERYPLSADRPLGVGESLVSVREIDCTSKRERTVSSTLYSSVNMGGTIVAATDQTEGWKVISPESPVFQDSQTLCNAHASPSPAAASAAGLTAHTGTEPPSQSR